MDALGMEPLPMEGGYFVESYRSEEKLPGGAQRSLATAIYYLLTPDTFSAMHRLRSDEVYHFYLGDPVEMLNLHPGGNVEKITLGPDLLGGMRLQAVVPKGVWQGSRVIPGGKFALLGTTMAPGFDPADYEHGVREELLRSFPDARDLILALTRG
jgi:predicted cupin superfamily sugar epimerase